MSDTRPLVFVAPFAFAFWGVMAWAYFIEWRQMQRKRAVSGSHGGADRYSGLVVLIVLGTAAIYVYRIEAEEAALEAALGEPYTQFKKTRKRLIPFVY
jgi:hypothetical protein